jgi:hypothetical protein
LSIIKDLIGVIYVFFRSKKGQFPKKGSPRSSIEQQEPSRSNIGWFSRFCVFFMRFSPTRNKKCRAVGVYTGGMGQRLGTSGLLMYCVSLCPGSLQDRLSGLLCIQSAFNTRSPQLVARKADADVGLGLANDWSSSCLVIVNMCEYLQQTPNNNRTIEVFVHA